MVRKLTRTFVILAGCALAASGCQSREPAKSSSEIAEAGPGGTDIIDALIERLAISQDPATSQPISTPGPDTPRSDARVQAYDAVEQLKSRGKEAFPRLLLHLEDERQSVCLRRMVPCTVGLTCFAIIEDMIFPLPDDYPGSFGRVGVDGDMHDRPLFSEPGPFSTETVAGWLEARRDKTLREMQIEAIEWLIARETKIGFPSDADKERYLRPLERQLDNLKR